MLVGNDGIQAELVGIVHNHLAESTAPIPDPFVHLCRPLRRQCGIHVDLQAVRVGVAAGYRLVIRRGEEDRHRAGGDIVQNRTDGKRSVLVAVRLDLLFQKNTAAEVHVHQLGRTCFDSDLNGIAHLKTVSRHVGNGVTDDDGGRICKDRSQIALILVFLENTDLLFAKAGIEHLVGNAVVGDGIGFALIDHLITEGTDVILGGDHMGGDLHGLDVVIHRLHLGDAGDGVQIGAHLLIVGKAGFRKIHGELRTGIFQLSLIDVRVIEAADEESAEHDGRRQQLYAVFAESPDRAEFVIGGEFALHQIDRPHRRGDQIGVVLRYDQGHRLTDGHNPHGHPHGHENHRQIEDRHLQKCQKGEMEGEAGGEINQVHRQGRHEDGRDKRDNGNDEQFPEGRTEQHFEIRTEGHIHAVRKLVLVHADIIKRGQQEDGHRQKKQGGENKGGQIVLLVIFKTQKRRFGNHEGLALSAQGLEGLQVLIVEPVAADILVPHEEQIHIVAVLTGHIVAVFIVAQDLEDSIILEHRGGIVDQIQILILIQIPQDHVIIVLVLHVLILDDIVVGVGYGDQSVKRLYDKQRGEETDVLLEIEEHALPGYRQTSLQILK